VISPQFDNGEAAGAGRFVDVTEYRVGRLDHATGLLTGTDFRRVDAGPDFYAPQTLVDESGRTVMVGWMGMPDHPGQPDLAAKHPTVANGWVHCLTAPREVSLDGDMLVAVPVAELAALRGAPVHVAGVRVAPGTALAPGIAGTALDLELSVGCPPGGTLEVRLRDGAAGRPVVLVLDPHAGTATLDRTRLGTGEGGVHTGSFRPGPAVDVRILLDHSSVEVFVDGGRLVMSARIYPVAGDEDVVLAAHGAAATVEASAWPMGGSGQ
jgi:beta-fructofuranosidase